MTPKHRPSDDLPAGSHVYWETLTEEMQEEIDRLRKENDLFRSLLRNVAANTRDSSKLNPDQARWKLKVIHEITEGMA